MNNSLINNVNALTVFAIFSAITYQSCTIKGSFAGLTSYYAKNYRENQSLYKILDSNEKIGDQKPMDKVLIITHKNMESVINNENKIVLYRWDVRCKSEKYYPLNVIYAKCIRKGITLYPIAEYYDNELMKANLNENFPILVPNTTYYGTNMTTAYLNKFYSQLSIQNNGNGRFYYLKNGRLTKVFRDLPTIDSLR